MDLSLSLLGWLHTAACVVALVGGGLVIVGRKGTPRHRQLGDVFTATVLFACVSSFGLYKHHAWTFAHWLAVFGIVTAGGGFLVARFKQPRFGWRYLHITLMVMAYYDLAGGLVNEVFLHVKSLQHFWKDAPQVIGMTHGSVMMAFILLLFVFLISTAVTQLRQLWRKRRAATLAAAAI